MIPLFDALAAHSSSVGCGGRNTNVRRSAYFEGRRWAFWSDGWRGLFVQGDVELPSVEPHILQMHSARAYGYVDSDTLRAFVDVDPACVLCDGTRAITCVRCSGAGRTPCPRCLGTGSCPCDCPHCHGCDCSECDAAGYIECRCGDGKEPCGCPVPLVLANGVTLDCRLLQGGILSLARGSVEVVTAGQTDPVLFRGSDWIALAMPRRPMPADRPRVLEMSRAPRRAA